MSMDIGSKLVSRLGSPDSKIPLAVKDSFNSAGYTYFSYDAGGSVEGKDRFVDEVGTGAIWLFGIPLYKKIIDNTLFKFAKISPKTDIRVVKDNNYLQEAIKNAPTEEILKELQKAGKNVTKTKALTLAKFAIAMGCTMLSYLGLTKLKQKMTKLNIEKEFNKKMNTDTPVSQNSTNDTKKTTNKEKEIFAQFNKYKAGSNEKYTPSFGSAGIVKLAEDFMLNPVKNMIILDVGISGERLANARTDGEFKEYGIKEGSFLFFVYCADRFIRKGLENLSLKMLKLPISLDAQFLSSNLASDILTNKEMQKQIKDFNDEFSKNEDTTKLYKFLFNNQNNTVVNSAKKSGIIETVKDKEGNIKIDTRKYIDPDKIKKLTKDLLTYIESGNKSNDVQKYITKVRGVKIASTMLSIGACCLSLGYLVPKFMYEYRHKQQNGNISFHVRTEYEKELAEKSSKKIN